MRPTTTPTSASAPDTRWPRFTSAPGRCFSPVCASNRRECDYTGYDVLYNDDGDYESTRPITGGDTYTQWLPSAHLRYSLDQETNVRAAYTRTLARPNYYDLVPYQIVFQEDLEIARGNSALKPTTSNNLDFLVERYFRSVGIVSGGVFYKRLNDYIYPFVRRRGGLWRRVPGHAAAQRRQCVALGHGVGVSRIV